MTISGAANELNETLVNTAQMFRSPMTPEQFNQLKMRQGAYDVLVRSNGKDGYIDRDQIGFRLNDLNCDVAFQPERGVYEFVAFRDGDVATELGEMNIEVGDRESVRELMKNILGEVISRVRDGGFPDMKIPILVLEELDAYRNRVPIVEHKFSAN